MIAHHVAGLQQGRVAYWVEISKTKLGRETYPEQYLLLQILQYLSSKIVTIFQ